MGEHSIEVWTALGQAALAFPNLRVGQLIGNALPPDVDVYYVSDEDLAKYLVEYVGKLG